MGACKTLSYALLTSRLDYGNADLRDDLSNTLMEGSQEYRILQAGQ